MRTSLFFSIVLFTFAFWLWRLPFLLWLPIPEFLPDTFDYFALVKSWHDKIPLASQPIDLPLGFPVFAYFIGFFSEKIIAVIWGHFAIKFFSGILLIYVCWKHFRWWAVPVSIALCTYVTDSFSLRFDTCLQTESLYSSFLIIATAFLIDSIESGKKLPLFLLSVSMFLVAFTRGNGLYIYFLIPVMIFALSPASQKIPKIACLLLPAALLQAGVYWCSSQSEYLRPSAGRMNSIINREKESLQYSSATYFREKMKTANEYITMIDVPSFYFSLLPERYRQLYEIDIIRSPDYKMYDWTMPVSDDLRKYVFREYYDEPPELKRNLGLMDVSCASLNHPLFLLIHGVYKIQSFVFRNIFWYLLSIALFAAGLRLYITSRFTNTAALMVFLLCAMHLFSIIAVTIGNSRTQLRYVHVSEFLLYLAPVFCLMLMLPAHGTRKI